MSAVNRFTSVCVLDTSGFISLQVLPAQPRSDCVNAQFLICCAPDVTTQQHSPGGISSRI